MTDNDIIKALECCINNDCDNCPFDYKSHFKNCLEGFLELIKRQQAEIERLEDMLDSAVTSEANAHYCYKDSRAEAIKEFADRLKEKAMQKFDWNEYVDTEDIYNLVKEIAGEDNG